LTGLTVPAGRMCIVLLSPFYNPSVVRSRTFPHGPLIVSRPAPTAMLSAYQRRSSLDRIGPVTRMRILLQSRLHACAFCCKTGYTHAHFAAKPVTRMRILLQSRLYACAFCCNITEVRLACYSVQVCWTGEHEQVAHS
jgi:hypothetical protein